MIAGADFSGVAKHSVGYPTPQTVANLSAETQLFDISSAQTTVELVCISVGSNKHGRYLIHSEG